MTPQQPRGGRPEYASGPRGTAFSRALDAERHRRGRALTRAEENEIRFRIVEKLAFRGCFADAKH